VLNKCFSYVVGLSVTKFITITVSNVATLMFHRTN